MNFPFCVSKTYVRHYFVMGPVAGQTQSHLFVSVPRRTSFAVIQLERLVLPTVQLLTTYTGLRQDSYHPDGSTPEKWKHSPLEGME